MLHHLELLLGSVGAVTAAERLLLGVRQVVMSEAGGPPEGLLAEATGVRPIVAVLTLVGLQDETSLEGFAAFLADVRASFTVLRVPVGTESVGSVSAVVTVVTGVRLVPCRGRVHVYLKQHLIYTHKSKCKKQVAFTRRDAVIIC